jgi:SAM-dependent methyltransferase
MVVFVYLLVMSVPNELIDRFAVLRNRARFDVDRGRFLHDEAIVEAKDRLAMVNKSFTNVALITGHPDLWYSAFPQAKLINDTETLNLVPSTFDLVIHAMVLHWSNDPLGQMIQCNRALSPDGLFLGVMMGGKTLIELRSAFAQAEAKITDGLSPRVLPMADIRDIGGLLQRAGFAMPVVDSVLLPVSYQTPLSLMRDLRDMGEANAQTARCKHFTARSLIEETIKEYSQNYSKNDDRVGATFEQFWLAGWAPSESQPKPLSPGSAKMHLSDALNVME